MLTSKYNLIPFSVALHVAPPFWLGTALRLLVTGLFPPSVQAFSAKRAKRRPRSSLAGFHGVLVRERRYCFRSKYCHDNMRLDNQERLCTTIWVIFCGRFCHSNGKVGLYNTLWLVSITRINFTLKIKYQPVQPHRLI